MCPGSANVFVFQFKADWPQKGGSEEGAKCFCMLLTVTYRYMRERERESYPHMSVRLLTLIVLDE